MLAVKNVHLAHFALGRKSVPRSKNEPTTTSTDIDLLCVPDYISRYLSNELLHEKLSPLVPKLAWSKMSQQQWYLKIPMIARSKNEQSTRTMVKIIKMS